MRTRTSRFLSEDHTYRDLTIVILPLLIMRPLFTGLIRSMMVDDLMVAAFLLFALFQITRSRRDVVVGLVLGVPAVAGGIFNALTPDTPAFNAAPVLFSISFLGFLVWRILGDVLGGRRITLEQVFGAICAYLLIAFLFAGLYGYLILVDREAFAFSDAIRHRLATGEPGTVMQILTYFSFVTLTTLGYGDISPTSQTAQTVALIEALIGQLYLAVMIAGLVGIHVAASNASSVSGRSGEEADNDPPDGP